MKNTLKNTLKKTSKFHLISLVGTILSFIALVITLVTMNFLAAQIVLGVAVVFFLATIFSAKQK